MSHETLRTLLAGQIGTNSRGRQAKGLHARQARVLELSCLLHRDVPAHLPWPAGADEETVRVTTLGNQGLERRDGTRGLVPDAVYHLDEQAIETVLVLGHTGCEVVADAYDSAVAPDPGRPAGVQARLDPLIAIVEAALDAGVADGVSRERTLARLVEYNVVRQVQFLSEQVGSSITVAGYVYDGAGVCGSPGERYLVTVDGVTDPTALDATVPDDRSVPVTTPLKGVPTTPSHTPDDS